MQLLRFLRIKKDSSISKLFPYLWPKHSLAFRLRFLLALFALILSKIASLAVSLVFKNVVDNLSNPHSEKWWNIPLYFILLYASFRVIGSFFNEVRIALFAPVENQAMRHVALQVFTHLQSLSLRFHLDSRVGGLSRATERGVKAIDIFLWFSINAFIPAFLELVFVTGAMWFLYNWRYALIAFFTIQFYVIFTILFTEWRTRIQRELNMIDTQANSRSVDALLNYETVKYFSSEKFEIQRFDNLWQSYEKLATLSKSTMALLNFGQGTIITLGLTGIMILAAFDVTTHYLTVGDFVLANTYLFQAFLPLSFLAFAYKETKHALVDMEDMFSLLDQESEIKDQSNAKNYIFKGGKIEFKNVSFSYHSKRKILRNISFLIKPGSTLAIIGESGSGKSTIVRLLFRFYEVIQGEILFDDQNIKNIIQKSIREAIGIVPQDTMLFNDTIYYNITYGNQNSTLKEVEEAAKAAQIHTFIHNLPERYNTLVGERGLKLSGGEKQRIAIARTLLKKPYIFVFDEATSALDTHTERELQKCLKSISTHHTTLIIAHRLSTIIHADEILLMSEGAIKERGTHKSLLAQNGIYADMWRRQQYEENLGSN